VNGWEWALLLLVLPLLLIGLYLRGLAGRLDRLHLRVDASTAMLDARLERRASLAGELAYSGFLDPASSLLLLNAASAAQHAAGDRDATESDLSAALRAVFAEESVDALLASGDPEARELAVDLATVCEGVVLARRFAGDAVRAAVAVRRRWLVRTLRLAGHAPWPTGRDLDDAPPPALTRLTLDAA
jgi:hypothetical protein